MSKQVFIETLKEGLEPLGFKSQSSKSLFYKKAGSNEYIYKVDVSNGRCDIYVRILLPEVEAIKKAAWGSDYEKFASVGDNLLNIARERSLIHFDDETSAKIRAQSEVEFFKSFVLGYYEKHSDTVYLDHLLNDEPGQHPFVCYNHIESGFLGLVVAYLHRKEKLGALVEYYRKVVETHNTQFLDEFERLTAYVTGKKLA